MSVLQPEAKIGIACDGGQASEKAPAPMESSPADGQAQGGTVAVRRANKLWLVVHLALMVAAVLVGIHGVQEFRHHRRELYLQHYRVSQYMHNSTSVPADYGEFLSEPKERHMFAHFWDLGYDPRAEMQPIGLVETFEELVQMRMPDVNALTLLYAHRDGALSFFRALFCVLFFVASLRLLLVFSAAPKRLPLRVFGLAYAVLAVCGVAETYCYNWALLELLATSATLGLYYAVAFAALRRPTGRLARWTLPVYYVMRETSSSKV